MENILAKVGSLTVTDREVEEFLAELGQRGKSYNSPEGRKAILEQLIASKLLLIDARHNLYETEPEFKAELARVRESLLINYAGSKVLSSVKVTDDEAQAYYEKNKDQFLGDDSANADHILVETEEQAAEILEKINTGAITFADAAKEYSSCPSRERGGNLGDFNRGQMVPEFDEAVFSMSEDEISPPVKTQFGYHIIKLNKKTVAEIIPYEEIEGEIKNMLLGEKKREAYDRKINQLKILYPVELL